MLGRDLKLVGLGRLAPTAGSTAVVVQTGDTPTIRLARPVEPREVTMKQMRTFSAALAILSVLFFQPNVAAIAQTTEQVLPELAKCTLIQNDFDRLLCYDAIADSLGWTTVKATASPTSETGNWRVTDETNPIDDSRTVVLLLAAHEGALAFGQRVMLLLRCLSKDTDVYINWNDHLGTKAHVVTRVGQEQAARNEWSLSTNKQSTFYPSNDIAFIKKLLAGKRLVAQVTPHNESPITAIFDLTGIENAIVPLRETCGW